MGVWNVKEHGALGDNAANDTHAIQACINQCASSGGGTVYFPNGTYTCGTLYLRSNITLQLEVNAVLLGSPNTEDYPDDTHYNRYDHESHMDPCFIYAEDAENICLTGPGRIDGNGAAFTKRRPMLLRFLRCKNIVLWNIRLQNPAAWATAFILCDGVRVDGVDIWSRANKNGDGLDFDSSQNITISNCRLDNSDDSICLQGSDPAHPVRNVTITNCVMTSRWAGIRIGMMSSGVIQDVTVSNCTMHDMGCSGLKIQCVEGGIIQDMVFQNIVMRNIPRPIFLTLNHVHLGKDAPLDPPRTGKLRRLSFDHICAGYDDDFSYDPAAGMVLLGEPGHSIEDITLSNISYTSTGGGETEWTDPADFPELTGQRPEFMAFKRIPSYGLFANHVRGLRVCNVRLNCLIPDSRHSMAFFHAENVILDNVDCADGGKMLLHNSDQVRFK